MSYGDDSVMVGSFVNGKHPAIQSSSDERTFFEWHTQRANRRETHEEYDRRTERQRADDAGNQAGLFLKRFVGVFGFRPLPDTGAEVAHDRDDRDDDADKAETTGSLPGQMARIGK